MLQRLLSISLMLSSSLVIPGCHAQQASTGRSVQLIEPDIQACSGCHSPDADNRNGQTAIPSLTALPAAYILQQMRAFQTDAIPNTVMGRIARGYADQELVSVADALGQE